jgi:hypothetical protein
MCGDGNAGCWGTVTGTDNFLAVQKVDTEETERVENDEKEGKDDTNVGWPEVTAGDLGAGNSQAELKSALV